MKKVALCLALLFALSSSAFGGERSIKYTRSDRDHVRVEVKLHLTMPEHITVLYHSIEAEHEVDPRFLRSFADPQGRLLPEYAGFCESLGHKASACYSVLAPALGENRIVTEFSLSEVRKLVNAGASFILLRVQRTITNPKWTRYRISIEELYRVATEELI